MESDDIFAGSVTQIFGIWKNLRIDDQAKIVRADLIPVGQHGDLLMDIYNKGGSLSMSTYGCGSSTTETIEGEQVEVIAESDYILMRVGDWVLYPSSKLYFSKADKTIYSPLEREKDEIDAKYEKLKKTN